MTVNPTARVEPRGTTDGGDSLTPPENTGQRSLLTSMSGSEYADGLRVLIRAEQDTSIKAPGLPGVELFDGSVKLAHNPHTGVASDAPFTVAQLGQRERPQNPERSTGKAESERVQQRIRQLEERFPHISITPAGQFLSNQDNLCSADRSHRPPENPNARTAIHSRLPNMRELDALQRSLEATGDSARTPKGERLKVTFANKGTEFSPNGDTGEGAHYIPAHENNGVAELRINPSGRSSTEELTHVFRHEIGHNAEFNAYPNGEHPIEVLRSLGFERVPNVFKTGAQGEPANLDAIKVRAPNGQEQLFTKLPPDCRNPQGGWARVNNQGQLLDRNGNVVPMVNGRPDDTSRIKPQIQDERFIQRNQLVRHPTPYQDNSNEVISDAFATWSGLSGPAKAQWESRFPAHMNAIRLMLDAQKKNLGR